MLMGADVRDQAAQVPNYGGVDSGGAGSTAGRDRAMGMMIESGLPNGVRVDGPPFEADRQLPHRPAGRIDSGMVATTVGDDAELSSGGNLPNEEAGSGAITTPERGATSRTKHQPGGQQPQVQQQPGGQHPQVQQQPGGQHPQVQQQQGEQQPQVQQSPGGQQPQGQPPHLSSGQVQRPIMVLPQSSSQISQQGPIVVDAAQAPGAPQAVAQLNEQRSALVTALHQRAARMLQSTADGAATTVAVNDGGYGEYAGEQVVWYSRLGSFFQKTMGPMMERLRAPPASTPTPRPFQSPTLHLPSSPAEPPPPEPLRKQVIQEWNYMNAGSQRLERQGDQSSNGSIPAEVVQEEVKRQVQLAMQTRDDRNQALQAENLELKNLLMEMIEVAPSQQGVRGGEAPTVEHGGPGRSLEAGHGPSAVSVQPPGQGELLRGLRDRDLPLLPVPVQGGVCAPPGLERSEGCQDGGDRPPLSIPGGGGANYATGKRPDVGGPNFTSRGEVPPGGGGGTAGPQGSAEMPDVGDTNPMGLLAKGIQQLQQLHLRREGPEPELLKGSLELPKLPEPYQDASSVAFLEWVYETGQVVGSITDKASVWWTVTLEAVMEAYHRYQMETPLKRLDVRPGTTPGLDAERWARLDKRVLALLMPTMTATIKQEILMLRLASVKDVLFKLYTVYAPGGAAERASLLRQLETIPTTTSVVDLIANMRRWKKLASRAAEMGVALPDGSVLLMAIEAAVKGVVDSNRDMAFKLNMAKQELQLPYKPTVSAVMVYADHVMAELHQIIPYTNKDAKLKGLSTAPSSPTSSATSPKGKGNGQPQPCKFWLSDDGCRRGAACKFSHQFATKEDKKARCWTCGSKHHRQGDCPTKQNNGKKGPKGGGGQGDGATATSSTTSPQVASIVTPSASGTMMAPPAPTMVSRETASTSATSTLEHPMASQQTTSSSEPSSTASTILFNENPNTGEIREMAEQFLAKIKRLAPMQAQTDGAVMDLELLLRSQGLGESHGMALLDSGASHAYRAPKSLEELRTSKKVKVQLADGKTVSLRQNDGGTLLADDDQGGTILPLGSLVSSLGCELEWSRKRGLQVRHPKHGLLPTKLVGNTPVLREAEALQLIADLEDIELNKLHGSTVEGAIKMLNVDERPSTWLDHLEEYINKGERKCLRRMLVEEESPLQAFTEEDIAALIGHDEKLLLSDEAGAHYLKALPYNRAHRKRLLGTRWIVHLYNGDESGHEFSKAESDDVTVVRMDIRDSRLFDLKNYGPAARALMWAAARGQIEGIIGAPLEDHNMIHSCFEG